MVGAEHSTVLVVEDDEDAQYLLQIFLEAEGFHVVVASNADAALQLMSEISPDMVLMDLMLPGMDGIQCCQIMRERWADDCPPILMTTGLSDEASINRAFAAGVTDYITKPINLIVLKKRIQKTLREQALVKQLELANAHLQKVCQTDALTQIANRRHFQNILLTEWRRLARQQMPLGLLLCDLDAFKQYNDTYGHLAGDDCLQQFADILRTAVKRPTDLVARYGGEEFAILLPNTDIKGLETVDRRIRRHLAQQALAHQSSWVDQVVTYSAGGITTIPQTTADPNHMVELADQALYQAKSQGRNRMVAKAHYPSLGPHCDSAV